MGRYGLQADRKLVPAGPRRLAEQEQIDQEGCRAAVVSHEVGHQDVDGIGVEGDLLHSGYYYSSDRYTGPLYAAMIGRVATRRRSNMITQLKFVGIPTANQERALRFYTEKLGFAVATDQPFNDRQRWIELRIGNSPTRAVLFTPDGQEDRIGTHFNGAFACDDVKATFRQLKERGVDFVKAPQKQPWGEFAIFKDPDGNQFVLSSS